jgi:hypothetical protein
MALPITLYNGLTRLKGWLFRNRWTLPPSQRRQRRVAMAGRAALDAAEQFRAAATRLAATRRTPANGCCCGRQGL